jgi:tetratricopeptide (TPR) repeat protein
MKPNQSKLDDPTGMPQPEAAANQRVTAGGHVNAQHSHDGVIGDQGTIVIQSLPQHRPCHCDRHQPRRVFISHTAELRALPERRSFIAAIEAAIIRAGDVVVDMVYFTAHDQPPAQLDHDTVARADVFLLLAGFCYGTPVRDRPELSYTEHEFETACKLGIPRLVFLLSDQAQGPARLFLDPQHGARQARFRQRLRDSGLTTTDVLSPDHAETLVFDALVTLPRPESTPAPVRRVWGIPARPTRFTGRDEQLSRMRAALTAHKPAVAQAVHGMGGVGKTTLALEYAHLHSDDYDIAWWIPAEQPDLIPDRLATLAHALHLASNLDTTESAVARLLGELRRQDRWLLVFDNAEDPSTLAPYLPGDGGHLIITSRNPHWDALAAPVELAEFTRTESVTLIRSRVLRLTEPDAEQVAQAVGDLPLAVDQAAALLADTGWTVPYYLQLLRHSAQRLLDRRDQADDYPLSVAASWQVAFDELADTEPAAVQLITFAAWLAPEPIPLTVFTDNAAMLPEPLATAAADPLVWARVLTVLRRRAVARVSPDSLLLHRIPATLLRTHSPVAAPQNGWAVLAVHVFGKAVPADPCDQPVTRPAPLPHVLTDTTAQDTNANVVGHPPHPKAIDQRRRGEPQIQLPEWNTEIRHLMETGRLAEANVLLDRMMAHPPAVERNVQAALLTYLSVLAWRLGRIPLALELAAEGWTDLGTGAKGPAAAQALGHLGYLLENIGNRRAALRTLRQAVRLARDAGRTDALAGNLQRLGGTLNLWAADLPQEQARATYEQARATLTEGLALHGVDHLMHSALLGAYGRSLAGLGELTAAADAGQQVLETADGNLWAKAVGEWVLATVSRARGELDQARAQAARATHHADQINDKALLLRFSQDLADICAELNDPIGEAEALRYNIGAVKIAAAALRDSLGQSWNSADRPSRTIR